MKTKRHDTRWMVSVALMAAIVVILANTPLGMIQLPVIKATTVHIPVIIGSIILGPLAGGILGGIFGVCSLLSNTMTPSLLSFAFSPAIYASSPFVTNPTIGGTLGTIWISVGCRICIGVATGWLYLGLRKLMMKKKTWQVPMLAIIGFAGSMVNTILVMGSIYFLFAAEYAQAKETSVTAVWGLVLGTVAASGVPEAIVAAILVAVITKVLLQSSRNILSR